MTTINTTCKNLVRERNTPSEDGEPEEVGKCDGCGREGNYYDGLCYQCQCDAHANGEYDMDGDGGCP